MIEARTTATNHALIQRAVIRAHSQAYGSGGPALSNGRWVAAFDLFARPSDADPAVWEVYGVTGTKQKPAGTMMLGTVRVVAKLGRPPLPPEERSDAKPRSVRLDEARWEKLKRLGTDWLERQIDKAK
jgi:hypothetical protein